MFFVLLFLKCSRKVILLRSWERSSSFQKSRQRFFANTKTSSTNQTI